LTKVVKKFGLEFYVEINACGEIGAHKSFYASLRGLDDVDKTLVSSVFELFAAILVLVNCTKDGDDFLFGRKRNGTGNGSAVALSGFNDLFSSTIDKGVIVALKTDSDLFFLCHGFASK
jgi:hypothetical protein